MWSPTLVVSLQVVCKTFWPMSAPSLYGLLNLILQEGPKWMSSIFHCQEVLPLLMGMISSWLVVSGYASATLLEVISVTATLQLQNKVRHCWNCEASTDDCMKLLYHSRWPEKMQWFEDLWKRWQPLQETLSETLQKSNSVKGTVGWCDLAMLHGCMKAYGAGAISGTSAAGQVIDFCLYFLSFINVV